MSHALEQVRIAAVKHVPRATLCLVCIIGCARLTRYCARSLVAGEVLSESATLLGASVQYVAGPLGT